MIKEDQKYILNVYKRMPVEIKKGDGCYLFDYNNTPFLDMFGGIAVNALGYNHPAIMDAFKQKDDYIHLSNFFVSQPVIDLAKLLVHNSFASKVFFSNSGTEAIEAAIKLARKWGKNISMDKVEFVAFHKGFHGRSSGGMALTGKSMYHEMFSPILPGVKHIEMNDIDALENVISHKTCAIFIEYIQGEGGVHSIDQKFLKKIYELKERFQFLVIADEIQTGLMRTGKLFAYMHYEYIPDLMTIAKSIGGGLPLGALLIKEEYENILSYGDHGSTFGGNPLACKLGVSVVNELLNESFIDNLNSNSTYLFQSLIMLKNQYPSLIHEIRGSGFMIGIEIKMNADLIKSKFLDSKILINITSQNVIRLLPPLIMVKKEIDQFINVFNRILEDQKGIHR